MASAYSFFADYIDYDAIEAWVAERQAYVLYGRIAFRPDTDRKSQRRLFLTREWVVEGRIERYDGTVGITVEDGYGADEGITLGELTRHHLRLVLDDEAAAGVEEDEVGVEFDLDQAGFVRLREELSELFMGLDVLRISDVEPDAAADTGA